MPNGQNYDSLLQHFYEQSLESVLNSPTWAGTGGTSVSSGSTEGSVSFVYTGGRVQVSVPKTLRSTYMDWVDAGSGGGAR